MKQKFIRIVIVCGLFLINSLITKAQTTELWGTNFRGGDENEGRLVKVTSTGAVSQSHGFSSKFSGAGASFLKPLSYNGSLYVISWFGGKGGVGGLTKYDPITNISTKVLDFNETFGHSPFGCNLIVYNNKFYGMTTLGGINNLGTIYEFDPATNIAVKKYDFVGVIGKPYVSTFEIFNDKFYALTASGGANSFGTLFEYDPISNTCAKKIDLNNDGTIGRQCFSGLSLFNGKLYGSMNFINNSNGCIFEYDPTTNVYTKKIILDQTTTLRNFVSKFYLDGTIFYAVCNQGDGQFGQGGIAEYNPALNVLTKKIQFEFSTGAGSFGGLTSYNGKYYGSNTVGGANSQGAFFEWNPVTNTITNRKAAGGGIGNQPSSSFGVLNNKLYTTCNEGNIDVAYGSSMVEWDVAANTIQRKFVFGTGDGAGINTKLVYHNGKVYGTTPKLGENFNGVLFSKDVNTGVYTQLYQFPSVTFNGSGISHLNVFNNKLYGVANQGGASPSGSGYIFEWDIATATFTKKVNLNATTGNSVIGQLYLHADNNFYGISRAGGAVSTGTIFKWDPTTNIYTVITAAPQGTTGGFVSAGGSLLYVPTTTGGGGYGSVYAFNITNGTGISVAMYNSSVGSASGEFTLLNGILYSGTSDGSNASGNIIAFNPSSNSLSIVKVLSPGFPVGASNIGNGSNGILATFNNELYGFCVQGGLNGSGTTFKYNPTTNVFTKLEDNGTLGGTITKPGNGFITVQTTVVLPVNLGYFQAEKTVKNEARLKWETSQEQNNKGFEIQRGKDGISFETIGWANSVGNTANLNSYSFIDSKPNVGVNYYRLKQIDIDGRQTSSDIRQLSFEKSNVEITIFPNPFLQYFTVTSNSLVPAQMTIFSVAGKILKQKKIVTGNNTINLAHLPSGIIFYRIIFSNGESKEGKLIKL